MGLLSASGKEVSPSQGQARSTLQLLEGCMSAGGAQHRWPAFFPVDCPPADAVAVVREVLRFVEHDPPLADDFQPVLLSGRWFPPQRRCEAAGLSVFTELADAAAYRRRFKGFRRRRVARGTIQPDHGLTEETPSQICPSHVTWWVAEGVAAETLFVIVPEKGP
jgi:hypothetical protein